MFLQEQQELVLQLYILVIVAAPSAMCTGHSREACHMPAECMKGPNLPQICHKIRPTQALVLLQTGTFASTVSAAGRAQLVLCGNLTRHHKAQTQDAALLWDV